MSAIQFVSDVEHTEQSVSTDMDQACRPDVGRKATTCRGTDQMPAAAGPGAEMDEVDQIAAHYLMHRLGSETPSYVRKVIRRLVETGQPGKAAAWSAIADAIAAVRPRLDVLSTETGGKRAAAARIEVRDD